jgi:hypothetical protein
MRHLDIQTSRRYALLCGKPQEGEDAKSDTKDQD